MFGRKFVSLKELIHSPKQLLGENQAFDCVYDCALETAHTHAPWIFRFRYYVAIISADSDSETN